MVGTADELSDISRLVDQCQAPVAADIVECLDLTPAIADHEERLARHGYRHDITGLLQLMSKSYADPVPGKHGLALGVPEFFVPVGCRRQSAPRFGFLEEGLQQGLHVACHSSDRLCASGSTSN